jgi:hypothetical protein
MADYRDRETRRRRQPPVAWFVSVKTMFRHSHEKLPAHSCRLRRALDPASLVILPPNGGIRRRHEATSEICGSDSRPSRRSFDRPAIEFTALRAAHSLSVHFDCHESEPVIPNHAHEQVYTQFRQLKKSVPFVDAVGFSLI